MCDTRRCTCGITPELLMILLLHSFISKDSGNYIKAIPCVAYATGTVHITVYYYKDADKICVSCFGNKNFEPSDFRGIQCHIIKLEKELSCNNRKGMV